MYHYLYKIISPSGKYYVGRHSTKNINDNYMGSGKWIRSIKDKTKLKKEIISFFENFDELLLFEKKIIEENIDNDKCMNYNNNSIGFSYGESNPAKRESQRKKTSNRVKGNKNPSKKDSVRKKISSSLKGKISPNKGKKLSKEQRQNISKGRTGIKYSQEGKEKLSKSRKIQYEKGERIVPSFEGKKHTEEYKQKMKESMLNRKTIICEYCNNEFKPHTFKRWHGKKCKFKNRTFS